MTPATLATGLGGVIDGTLRQYGVFDENGLVAMPESLDFKQASTLSCAALTAWNGLYGLESRSLKQGDTVLTQGTGGVSMFALQVSTVKYSPANEVIKMLRAKHSLLKPPVPKSSQPPAVMRKPNFSRS